MAKYSNLFKEAARYSPLILPMSILVLMLYMLLGTLAALSATHYIGEVRIVSEAQEADLTLIIDNHNEAGPLGLWNTPYKIKTLDGGERILDYAFFSWDEDLPFTKDE